MSKITPAQWMNVVLIIEYALLAIGYGLDGHFPKTLYWIGAGVISFSILIS